MACRFLLIFRAIVDYPVQHIEIILKGHFSIAQRIVIRNEAGQLLESESVCVVAFDLMIQPQHDDITDAQTVTMKILRPIQIKTLI